MVAIANDHGGYELKKEIIKYFEENNVEYENLGADSPESTDYPVYARKVADAILSGRCGKGILICGTGIGISIAANRIQGIRAAVCTDSFMAKATRMHNDANVIALGARVLGVGSAVEIVDSFLNTEFSGDERHLRRISLIDVPADTVE